MPAPQCSFSPMLASATDKYTTRHSTNSDDDLCASISSMMSCSSLPTSTTTSPRLVHHHHQQDLLRPTSSVERERHEFRLFSGYAAKAQHKLRRTVSA